MTKKIAKNGHWFCVRQKVFLYDTTIPKHVNDALNANAECLSTEKAHNECTTTQVSYVYLLNFIMLSF